MLDGIAADGCVEGLLPVPVLDALEPLELGGIADEPELLGFESLGVALAGVCAAGVSGVAAVEVVGAGAAEPAALACAPGLSPSLEPQPRPATTSRVSEQDASVRAYVLVMTVPSPQSPIAKATGNEPTLALAEWPVCMRFTAEQNRRQTPTLQQQPHPPQYTLL
jgi:hypothetical protein